MGVVAGSASPTTLGSITPFNVSGSVLFHSCPSSATGIARALWRSRLECRARPASGPLAAIIARGAQVTR